jgi:hypothetical protein
MNQAFNFHDTWIIAQHNWWLVLVALGLGIWVGWTTTTFEAEKPSS